MRRPLARVLLVALLLSVAAGPAPGLEVQYRPVEPDPIMSPMPRPQVHPVEIPDPKILPLATPVPNLADPAPAGEVRRGLFVFAGRDLGKLAVRDGKVLRVFRLSPLMAPLPADLAPGDRVEIEYTRDLQIRRLTRR